MTQKITEYLRKLKGETGYTHSQLADMTGIPYGTIPKYFSGMDDDSANFEIVRKLVMAMDGSLDELAGIVPKPVAISEEKLTEDGFTESEIKVILRWASSQVAHSYQALVAGLEARLSEKDERLTHCSVLLDDEHRRAQEEIMRERKHAHVASVISYVALGLFVLLFFMDFLIPTIGWIQRG